MVVWSTDSTESNAAWGPRTSCPADGDNEIPMKSCALRPSAEAAVCDDIPLAEPLVAPPIRVEGGDERGEIDRLRVEDEVFDRDQRIGRGRDAAVVDTAAVDLRPALGEVARVR